MKALAVMLLCASAAWGAGPGALTTIHAIRALSREDAAKGLPVAFEGTVTYYARSEVYGTSGIDLFVQDGNECIYVQTQPNQDLTLGDRVLVRGKTLDSFRTDVVSESVVRLHPGELPKPLPATYEQLIRAEMDCMRVTVHATVRSADRVGFGNLPGIDLKLLMDGGSIDATAVGKTAIDLKEMLDAEVEVTGVAAGIFDSKNQITGIVVEIPSLADIKILKKNPTSPEALPLTPMDEVLSAHLVQDQTHRVRVQGTITYYQPGSAVVLQNGAKSLWVMTQYEGPLRVGDWADATGFPEVNGTSLTLTLAEIQDSQHLSPIAPQPVSGEELASGSEAFNLVSVEGKVLTTAREAAQDEYVLKANGKVFSAIYRHPQIAGADLPPMKDASVGSRVRVTGICMLEYGSDPFHGPVAMDVLLRSFDDIAEVSRPPLATVRNLGIAAGLLFILVLAAGARGWNLERKMRQNTAEVAYVERRRSRILEDINASRPLAEIIEQVTELVSFNLKGSPCWCRIAGGAQLGNCPPQARWLSRRPGGSSVAFRPAAGGHLRRPRPAHSSSHHRGGGTGQSRGSVRTGYRNPPHLLGLAAPLGIRSAHRHAQPLLPGQAAGHPDGRGSAKGGHLRPHLRRPEPVQADQRPVWPPGGRPLSAGSFRADEAAAPLPRHAGAPGRRRVCRAGFEGPQPRQGGGDCEPDHALL